MEITLNLVWLVLASAMLVLWIRQGRQRWGTPDRPYMQMVAFAVLLLILFPVISVTDDLQAAQGMVETDSSLRRDVEGVQPHSIYPAIATMPEPGVSFPLFVSGFMLVVSDRPFAVPSSPLLSMPVNRPPPVA
jgi:hypothetical protein